MKLYKIIDTELQGRYFTTLTEAKQHFRRLVAQMDFANPNHSVDLYEVKVRVDKETVLNLLNGSGGYEESETPLKSWRGK